MCNCISVTLYLGRLVIDAVMSRYEDKVTRGITEAYVKGGFNSGKLAVPYV
jgi:hypothetical protein